MNSIITIKTIRYSEELLEEAKKEPYFGESVWTHYDKYMDREFQFNFEPEVFGDHLNYIKTYVYHRIKEGFAMVTIQNELGTLRRAAKDTYGFSQLTEDLLFGKNCTKTEGERRAIALDAYFRFIQLNLYEVEEIISNHRGKAGHKGRNLIDMDSLLVWDCIIDDFVSTARKKDLLYFYPVVLWWKIGGVIPMRMLELCLIKYDCIRKEDGRCRITIPTVKERQNREPAYSDLTIDHTLYRIIDGYREMTKKEEREYLFSEKEYKKRNTNREHRIHMNPTDFGTLLDQFTKAIVIGKCRYNIVPKGQKKNPDDLEKIAPMDLRHMAMCNMCLQGIDPITIQRMARHKTVQQQSHYINNALPYAMSKITILSQRIKMKIKGNFYSDIAEYDEGAFDDRTREISLIQAEQKFGVPIGDGVCVSDTPLVDCPSEDCDACPFYLPRSTNENSRIAAKLNAEIAALADAVDTMKIIYKSNQIDGLKELGQQVDAYINRSAVLKAKAELLAERGS